MWVGGKETQDSFPGGVRKPGWMDILIIETNFKTIGPTPRSSMFYSSKQMKESSSETISRDK